MRFSRHKTDDLPRRRRVEIAERTREEMPFQSSRTFRRNQTLTGSASSNVQSLGEANAHIKSPRVHAHALAKTRRHLGLMLFAVLIVAALLYSLISQFTAGVIVEATPDTSLKLDSSYAKTIESYLQSQPTERLRFLLDSTHLQGYVQAVHPEVKSVQAGGSAGFGSSQFLVTLRTPIAGWTIDGQQQFVDASGVAFTKNYFPTPAVQIVDKSGVHITAGQAIASNHFLGFVGQVVGLTKTRGFTATQVIIPAGTTRQIEVRLKGIGYPVKLSVDRPAGEQVEDMTRAVRWMMQHHLSPEYVDVRVSGKAFYR